MADTAGGLKMSTAEIIGLIEILRSAAPGLIVKQLRKIITLMKKRMARASNIIEIPIKLLDEKISPILEYQCVEINMQGN